MRLRECSLLILTLLAVSLPAQASQWYPLDTGRFWVYSSPDGWSASASVKDPAVFAGALVQPLHWDSGVGENFSQDGAGRVFNNGLYYPDGTYVVFDPPFLWMDSDLTPGHAWETTYDAISYDAADVEVGRTSHSVACSVVGSGPVDVPAGTFQAVEILIVRDAGSQPTYTFRNWYAEGVGFIRRTDAGGTTVLFELESYGGATNRTEAVTWGSVKALYRQ